MEAYPEPWGSPFKYILLHLKLWSPKRTYTLHLRKIILELWRLISKSQRLILAA
jgi:hypothetical protein